MTTFDNIRPYNDTETVAALRRVSRNPLYPIIAKYLFPGQSIAQSRRELLSVHNVTEFQEKIMYRVVKSVIDKTMDSFTYSGIENIKDLDGQFVAITNHRDIVLDPALLEYSLIDAGMKGSQICIGNNLLSSQLIKDLMLSNRSITVIRDANPRDLIERSRTLSSYIRHSINDEKIAVWIAQREGRAKDGLDITAQGVLKMLNMSGEGSFTENFAQLHLVPMTYSYELESCDARKAREILVKRRHGKYKKGPFEDTISILTGILQKKGRVHLTIGKPISIEELEKAAACKGNDRFKELCSILDTHINNGYHLWKTNYIAADILGEGISKCGTSYFDQGKYTEEDRKDFETYMGKKLSKISDVLQGPELKELFLHIYANPVR